MPSVSLTGQDTIIISGRALFDIADDDNTVLDYPNELAAVKTGKNGNIIYAFNATGQQCDVTLRVLLGSSDDKFLNSLLRQMQNDFSLFRLLDGRFIKRVGDGTGIFIQNVTYVMQGGVFTKNVVAKSNSSGDTEQSVSVYQIRFGNAPRSIL